MRLKFFYFTLALLLFTVLATTALHFYFFATERRLLIDHQIEASASALIASDFSQQLLENIEEVDDILKDVLGEERVDLVIGIFDLNGNLLFRNAVGRRIPVELSDKHGWSDISFEDHQIRVLTISTKDLIIQVGLVLDSTIERWKGSNKRIIAYLFFLFLFIIGIAYTSSSYFFRPIKSLAADFRFLTEKLKGSFGKSLLNFEMPIELKKYLADADSKDELKQLAAEIGQFISVISDYSKNIEAQSAVLTHELKTPLTVLYSILESAIAQSDAEARLQLIKEAQKEVKNIASMVNSFLHWAVFTSSNDLLDLYAVKVGPLLVDVKNDLDRLYPNRLEIEDRGSGTVLALPQHLHQVIRNLLENALKYSPPDKKINVIVSANEFLIKDQGPGIPAEIIQNLGTPFNRANKRSEASFGLGLAWVHSICKRYNWKLEIRPSSSGTEISIVFV